MSLNCSKSILNNNTVLKLPSNTTKEHLHSIMTWYIDPYDLILSNKWNQSNYWLLSVGALSLNTLSLSGWFSFNTTRVTTFKPFLQAEYKDCVVEQTYPYNLRTQQKGSVLRGHCFYMGPFVWIWVNSFGD